MSETERIAFRIVYPLAKRPRLFAPDPHGAIEVLDVAERGLRLVRPASLEPVDGMPFAGRLTLLHGPSFAVSGHCLRITARDFALRLDEPSAIPVPAIFEEQRWLRARFPDWR